MARPDVSSNLVCAPSSVPKYLVVSARRATGVSAGARRDAGAEQTWATLDTDDVQVLGARVVGAVHHGANRETERHLELVAGRAGALRRARRQQRNKTLIWRLAGTPCAPTARPRRAHAPRFVMVAPLNRRATGRRRARKRAVVPLKSCDELCVCAFRFGHGNSCRAMCRPVSRAITAGAWRGAGSRRRHQKRESACVLRCQTAAAAAQRGSRSVGVSVAQRRRARPAAARTDMRQSISHTSPHQWLLQAAARRKHPRHRRRYAAPASPGVAAAIRRRRGRGRARGVASGTGTAVGCAPPRRARRDAAWCMAPRHHLHHHHRRRCWQQRAVKQAQQRAAHEDAAEAMQLAQRGADRLRQRLAQRATSARGVPPQSPAPHGADAATRRRGRDQHPARRRRREARAARVAGSLQHQAHRRVLQQARHKAHADRVKENGVSKPHPHHRGRAGAPRPAPRCQAQRAAAAWSRAQRQRARVRRACRKTVSARQRPSAQAAKRNAQAAMTPA